MDHLARKAGGVFLFLVTITALALPQSPDVNPPVPVQTVGGYLMIVPVTINGAGPYQFLLDTGTNTTLVDPSLAAELSLKSVGKMALTSLASSVPVHRYF